MDSSLETDALMFAQQAEQVLAQLRARLTDEEYRLVWQLRYLEELATVAACTAAEERLLEVIVAHFPEQALAVQAVIAHVRATGADCETLQGRQRGAVDA
jgi:hypothetical protein